MSRIISVLNYKGGTGKTTTVVNLSAGLAIRGAKVLCIDLDAQGNLAAHLGLKPSCGLPQLLMGDAPTSSCILPARKNLDLIASDSSLMQAEGALWQMGSEEQARRSLVERLGSFNGYDFVILDHSPSASLLNESGLMLAQELIVPVSMDYLALLGVRQVIEVMKNLAASLDHNTKLTFVVPTFYDDRLRKDRDVMQILHRHFGSRVTAPIHANVSLSEAPAYHKSIYEYAPSSSGAVDYAHLVERVAANGT
jgi:chromosome partitioning protein